MKRAVYLKSARRDRRAILVYIVRRSQTVRVGQRFMKRMVDHLDHLASLPFEMDTSHSDLRLGLRSIAFENYVIFFQYQEDRFEVVNILEGHRDIPEYFSATESA